MSRGETTIGAGGDYGGLRGSLQYCERIALAGRNNLSQAARLLTDRTKYHLFTTTYAAMRIVDDAIDVHFLSKPPQSRRECRAATLRIVEKWLSQSVAASRSEYESNEASFEPLVFEALNFFLGGSEIGLGPWQQLARSLRCDVREENLLTWEDFLRYCEGACVAPGAVFIYILGCDVLDERRTALRLPSPMESYARDMSIFCYLVHIVRDLPADATRNKQLLTIPQSVLSKAHLSVEDLAEAVRSNDRRTVAPVIEFLLGQAEDYAGRATATLVELRSLLRGPEHRALASLYDLYRESFVRLAHEYQYTDGRG